MSSASRSFEKETSHISFPRSRVRKYLFMNSSAKKGLIAALVVTLVLVIDQIIKIWVKTNMAIQDSFPMFGLDWFQIHFVENPGMAFGIEAGGKLFLTLFRIVAAVFITLYLARLVKDGYKTGFIACVALVLAGASGNIIDSIFYGMIFEASHVGYVASFVPWGEGYASLFHGKVVDMFYFPLIRGTYPDWFPFVGGQEFLFFRFIFNIADSAISVGVVLLLIFYRKTLSYSLLSKKEKEKLEKETVSEA